MEKPKPIRLLLFVHMLENLRSNNRIVFKIGEQEFYLEAADFRFEGFVLRDQHGNSVTSEEYNKFITNSDNNSHLN